MHRPVPIPDGLCDRPDLSVLDWLSIHGGDRHDSSSSSTHEDLISFIGHLNRDILHSNFMTTPLGSVDHTLSGNSLQNSSVRGVNNVVLDKDNVETRSFGDVCVAVGEEGVLCSTIVCFEHAAGEITPLEVLDGGIHGSRRDSTNSSCDNGITADVLSFGAHDPDVGLDDQVEVVVQDLTRLGLTNRLQATSDNELNKSILDSTLGEHVEKSHSDLIAGNGELHSHLLDACLETVEMVIKTEETTIPDCRDIVGQVAVHETLVHEGNAGFIEGDKLALDPGNAVGEDVVACDEGGLALGVAGEDLVHGRHSGGY